MSRVSIGRRITRLMQHWRPGESLAGRVARLNDADRERYEAFLRNNAAVLASLNDNPSEAFGALLNGGVALDELPQQIADALMPECVPVRRAMAAGDYHDAWQRMAHPDRG